MAIMVVVDIILILMSKICSTQTQTQTPSTRECSDDENGCKSLVNHNILYMLLDFPRTLWTLNYIDDRRVVSCTARFK